MSVKIQLISPTVAGAVAETTAGKRYLGKITGVDFTQVQDIYLALPANPRFVALSIKAISTLINTLSVGATMVVKIVNRAAPIAAALTTALTGSNNDIVLTAKTAGKVGNSITLTLVNPGANAAASVSVAGSAITVNLAYASSAITTTGAQLVALINGNTAASALVTAALAAGNDGTGLVTALSATNLTTGSDYTSIGTVSASATLSSATVTNGVESPSVSSSPVLHGPYALLFSITGGSTATTDAKDIIVDLLAT